MAIEGTPYGILLSVTREANFETTVLTEAVTVTDRIVRATTKVLSDSATATGTALKGAGKVILNTVTSTDTFSRVFVAARTLVESVNVLDTIRKTLNGYSTIWSHMSKSVAGTWTKVTKSTTSWTHMDRS